VAECRAAVVWAECTNRPTGRFILLLGIAEQKNLNPKRASRSNNRDALFSSTRPDPPERPPRKQPRSLPLLG
jgi:hypothetical protein